MKTISVIAALSMSLMAGCAATSRTTNLSDLITRHTIAMGGASAIEATRTVEYRIQIEEPAFKVEGLYVADRQGRMRIDIYAEGSRVYTEAFDGRDAWQMEGDGVAKPSRPEGAAALWHGTQFPGKLLGLHEMAKYGHKLELTPDEILDGTRYHVIKLTFRDGFVSHLYLDTDTLMIERQRDERAIHPDADPSKKWLENRMDDFRSVDGVMRSMSGSQIDVRTGATLQTSKVTSLRVNVPIAPKLFSAGS